MKKCMEKTEKHYIIMYMNRFIFYNPLRVYLIVVLRVYCNYIKNKL